MSTPKYAWPFVKQQKTGLGVATPQMLNALIDRDPNYNPYRVNVNSEYLPSCTTELELEETYPTVTKYGIWLNKMGFKFPIIKGDVQYIDVHGNNKFANPDQPFTVVTYQPYKSEKYYRTALEAMVNVPSHGDWQVINVLTGEILLEPH